MNFLDALLGVGAHASNHVYGGDDEIDADNLHVSRTATHYGILEPTLESHLSGIDDALGGLGNPPADPNHSIPYNSGGAFAWSTQVFCGGTWLGVAASETGLPSSGAIRLGLGYVITVKDADGETRPLLFAAGGPGATHVYLGYSTFVSIHYLAATHSFEVNGTAALTVGDGYIGVGASAARPTSGAIRLPALSAIWAKNNSSTDFPWISHYNAYSGGGLENLALGHAGNLPELGLYAANQIRSWIGTTQVLHVDATNGWDLKGLPLTNFCSGKTTADVAIPADSSPHTVLSHTFPGTGGQAITIGCRVRVWEGADVTNRMTAETTCHIVIGSGSSQFENTPGDDQKLSTTIDGVEVSYDFGGTNILEVYVTSTTTACRANAKVWHQPAETLSPTP